MMILVCCRSCERKLRVPEELIGRPVKCPGCGTTFTGKEDGSPTTPSPVPEPAEAPPTDGEGPVTDPSRAPESSRRRRPARGREDEDDWDEDVPVARRGSAAREAARRKVWGPASALQVVAILGLILHGLDIALRLGMTALQLGGGPRYFRGPDAVAGTAFGIALSLSGIVVCVVVFLGTMKMKSLDNYGLALTAALLAMAPVWVCCVAGLPVGIWAVVVLCNASVKAAFR
jgi:hypothetical protein